VNTGEHYIPLSSGGQIHLKAESFPIVNLSNGKRVIIDLYGELPERMAQVITSNWEDYGVAHLQSRDDLRGALSKIFPLCEYHRLVPERRTPRTGERHSSSNHSGLDHFPILLTRKGRAGRSHQPPG
jgi:hypothetical protein